MMPFPEEHTHLAQTRTILATELADMAARVERYDAEYMDTKRYISEFRSDPKEIFQNELLLADIERSGISAVKNRERLEKLLASPYFARIDFQGDLAEDSGVFYVGRFTFTQDFDILIYDWRAPVASMFYDCEVGRAGFAAPVGQITGELTRKRQFKITDGRLEYVLESSLNIQDDVLQRELAATSDDKMKAIIATIQKEQNRIIREEKAKVLIIQGVAGSGKTSIALHRIAYLLYRFKDTLRADQVAILSPNKVFGDYIADVLPELGEEPIFQLGFADLARVQLAGVMDFQAEEDWLATTDSDRQQRARRKSTGEFLQAVQQFLSNWEDRIFQAQDYCFGRFVAPKDWLAQRFQAYQGMPVKRRLREMAGDVHNRLAGDNVRGEDLPAERSIAKALSAMLTVSGTLPLYQRFCAEWGGADLLVMAGKKTLEWADVYPFLYFYHWFEGLQENKRIRHLVIDEMQDYTPLMYAVINQMFQCQKTILGDFGQRVNPCLTASLADLQQLYAEGTTVELNTSYRCSYQICQFAKAIMPEAGLEAVERYGDEVDGFGGQDAGEELQHLEMIIDQFRQSEFATLGILVKTTEQARTLAQALANRRRQAINLIEDENSHFVKGVSVAAVRMAKGLEFDQVVIAQADVEQYHNDADRRLLYVAATRAMHKLSLTWSGEKSPLLDFPPR